MAQAETMLLYSWKLFCFFFFCEKAEDQGLHFWPFLTQALILQDQFPAPNEVGRVAVSLLYAAQNRC